MCSECIRDIYLYYYCIILNTIIVIYYIYQTHNIKWSVITAYVTFLIIPFTLMMNQIYQPLQFWHI